MLVIVPRTRYPFNMPFCRYPSCLGLILFLFSPLASAQVNQNFRTTSLPQYEMGAGVIGLNLPNYPGSGSNRIRVVPFPYYIYRGEYFRSDDEGTRARLFSSPHHETGFSLGFNFPVNSGDNPSRQGMPNLDALVSFGPRVLFRFLTEIPNHRLNLTFATRAAFSSKFSFNSFMRAEGFSFEPRVSYWYRWQRPQISFFSSLSFEFGTAQYARFFYDVPAQYVTAERPLYNARAGLIETAVALGGGKQIHPKLFMFAGTSWRNLDLAINRDSPLVETRHNIAFLLGLVWTFYESEEKVKLL